MSSEPFTPTAVNLLPDCSNRSLILNIPEIIGLCVLLNLWGLFVYFRQTSKIFGGKYEILRSDMVEAGFDERRLERLDKVVGYKSAANEEGTDSNVVG